MKPKAWIVDVDGTIALRGDRSPYDMTRVGEDRPHTAIVELVDALCLYNDHGDRRDIIYVSGRNEAARGDTEQWINDNLACRPNHLFMRPDGDSRSDEIIKAEILDRHILPTWDVVGVIDDRNRVVDMWRSKGLTCLQVAPGDF